MLSFVSCLGKRSSCCAVRNSCLCILRSHCAFNLGLHRVGICHLMLFSRCLQWEQEKKKFSERGKRKKAPPHPWFYIGWRVAGCFAPLTPTTQCSWQQTLPAMCSLTCLISIVIDLIWCRSFEPSSSTLAPAITGEWQSCLQHGQVRVIKRKKQFWFV